MKMWRNKWAYTVINGTVFMGFVKTGPICDTDYRPSSFFDLHKKDHSFRGQRPPALNNFLYLDPGKRYKMLFVQFPERS